MTILVFHQYFTTNKGAYGTRLYEFASQWLKEGHKVKVVTSVYYKSDINSKDLGKTIDIDGIEVIVLNIPVSNKDNELKRIYYFLKYSLYSIWFALTEKYDMVLFSSGPISTGIPGLMAKFLKRKPIVFEVRDLWPGVVEEIGIIKNRVVLGLAYFFESVLYRSSDLIITLSPGMEENIQKRFPKARISTITNCANFDLFKNIKQKRSNSKFAIYMGNIGAVNNSELIFNAAKILQEKKRDDIKVVMIGDGQMYLELLGKVKMEGITNLSIHRSMPKLELIRYLGNAFVSIVPLIDVKILDSSSPNKLYESFAAGIPVIQTTGGWIKNLMDEYDVGSTVDPNQPEQLAEALIYYYDHPEEVERKSINCKNLAQERFESKKLASMMIHKMEEVLLT